MIVSTRTRQNAADALILVGCLVFIGRFIPWDLVFSGTTPFGGDTPSHYAAFVYFLEHILPTGRLSGWHPGNLAGFPLFQFYFPGPFILMAGLAQLIGPSAAYKLTALLPALAFPISIYISLRIFKLAFPGPALGAIFSLTFLFAETNQVWGGNLASMLAGETTYAFAFNLAPIYLAWLKGWVDGRRSAFGAALLLALIGFCHAYGLLFCLLAGLYFLLEKGRFKLAAARIFIVYAVAGLLLGVWVLPMLAYSPYTEMFNIIWILDSWKDFFPKTFVPAMILAGLGLGLLPWLGDREDRRRAGYLVHWVWISAFLFLFAPVMNSVTIRFAPFGHLAVILLAAQAGRLALSRLRSKGLYAGAVLLAAVGLVGHRIDYLDHWLRWNNTGFEAHHTWRNLGPLSRALKGTAADPRVIYEHSDANRSGAGAVRVFECLPYLAGRSTLEGLYLQASPNAPFIFYLQSLVSKNSSMPLPGYPYGRLDLDRAVDRMILFNVNEFIASTPETIAAARKNHRLILTGRYGPLTLFKVRGRPTGYAVRPGYRPTAVITDRPQYIAHLWFRLTDVQTPLVFLKKPPADPGRFAAVLRDDGKETNPLILAIRANDLPRKPLPPAEIKVRFSAERIDLSGLEPGRPVLVKVSYHPGWRTLSGEKVYRTSPAFMLVYPESDRLSLVYRSGWPLWLGWTGTLLGLIGLIILWRRPNLIQIGWARPPEEAPAPGGWLRWTALVLISLAPLAWLWTVHHDAALLRHQARALEDAPGDKAANDEAARKLYNRSIELFPYSYVIDYALYDLAINRLRNKAPARAEELLRRVVEDFPDSPVLPESLYHLGQSLEAQGRQAEATAVWRRLVAAFPGNHWAKIIADRVSGHGS